MLKVFKNGVIKSATDRVAAKETQRRIYKAFVRKSNSEVLCMQYAIPPRESLCRTSFSKSYARRCALRDNVCNEFILKHFLHARRSSRMYVRSLGNRIGYSSPLASRAFL